MTHPTDKELDDYLRRDSAVTRSYRELDDAQVPASLDSAVLAQARAAIAKPAGSAVKQRPTWMRWGPPLALAASAVMVVAIVLEVGVQDPLQLPAAAKKERGAQESATVAAEVAPAQSTEAEAVADVMERPLESVASRDVSAQVSPPPASPTFSAATEPRASAAPPERKAVAMDATKPAVVATRRQQAAEAEEVVVTGQRRREQAFDVPLPVDVIAEADNNSTRLSETAAENEEVRVTSAQPSDVRRTGYGPRAPGAPTPRPAAAPQPSAAARSAAGSVAQADTYSTPELWLVAIRKLRADGKESEADEQWRLFRVSYPDFLVPATDTALPQAERSPR